MRFVLLFCGTESDQAAFESLSPDELRERYGEVGRWFAENGSKLRGSNQLQPRELATTARHDPSGPVVTDGPFIEGNELIGGYAEIEVAGLDEALTMATTWPGGGAVEIRPVVERGPLWCRRSTAMSAEGRRRRPSFARAPSTASSPRSFGRRPVSSPGR
jgi:hypothetical protein